MTRIASCLLAACVLAPAPAAALEPETARVWIEEMKSEPRGPFARVRWFCADGAVLPPEPYACRDRGGGRQHGEWTERALRLREAGYRVANVLAAIEPAELIAREDFRDRYNQILIEQFLISADDGWILRRARYYRGALQEEAERRAARRLLHKLAEDRYWLLGGYLPLRVGAALLPHGDETASVTEVRQLSASLAQRDPEFASLRNKIHVRPEAGDAQAVRAYARGVPAEAERAAFERLARLIDEVYAADSTIPLLEHVARTSRENGDLSPVAADGAARLARAATPAARFSLTAELMSALRARMTLPNGPALRLRLIDASLALESEHFAAATALRERLGRASRRERLGWLRSSVDALYGAGLLSERQRAALLEELRDAAPATVKLAAYKRLVDYLALVPGWGSQWLRLHFYDSVRRLAEVEPRADLFLQDQLRGSPLFFYAQVLDSLLRDANRLAGVRTELFGEDVGAGLRALNPGLARGVLRFAGAGDHAGLQTDGVYLLPETVSDLPPVAGILTRGEGNPLSHVQLLARNLGIPNVGVDEALVPRLEPMRGERVLLAVSPAGSIRLARDDGDAGDALAEGAGPGEVLIRPDLDKLDLGERGFLRLSELGADDSGRVVGPKAAQLGELRRHYPEAVAEGLAIPFGAFRALLERVRGDSGETVFEWMAASYERLAQMPAGSAERAAATDAFREALHAWISKAEPGEDFRRRLRAALAETFGEDGSYGVFVRSDTNVEDLPGFTGAGLNLTVPNVVGFRDIMEAIPRVWASPFTARAFAWRQTHMDKPQHVYPAVLLMRSVPVEKSGVLVTQDIDTGDPRWLSVAVNEGVGGAVDGQAAESLRIHVDTGEVRLLAQATAPDRRVVGSAGGVQSKPVTGADRVLEPQEVSALIEFAKQLPERFPAMMDDEGRPTPADVEFGFLDGRLMLFQIRPFLESKRARGSSYLKSLDDALRDLGVHEVDLDAVPGEGAA